MKQYVLAALVASATSVSACGHYDEPAVEIRSVTVHLSGTTQKNVTLAKGGTVRIAAEARDEASRVIPGVPIAFHSANSFIIDVGSDGLMTAKSPGTAFVFAEVPAGTGILRDSVTATVLAFP